MSFPKEFKVNSPNVKYSENYIHAKFDYNTSSVQQVDGVLTVEPKTQTYVFRTDKKVRKTGLMIVGLGGNNGSTVTGAIIANKLGFSWQKRSATIKANYLGSITQSTTIRVGTVNNQDVYIPFNTILPMVHPNDLVIGGWDINGANLAEAMNRADVFDADLQKQLAPHMEKIKPLPSYYDPDFIAANQSDRADNCIKGTKEDALEKIRKDLKEFKETNKLDHVVVVWSANTERFADIMPGVNDTAENLLASIRHNHYEIAPSTIFAVACILEKVPFINGSPQNTFVPGVVELAHLHKVPIGGDDFKSGQTKLKSVMVDFLVNAGIKPVAITSYNHLGNNDGKNLSAPKQFRSKEISKSNVVDDMVESNQILYKPGEHPDHTVVIKYVPAVGDSKRAMDEYYNEIFMGGSNTIALHNTCEDSLLASPLIIDLCILTELMGRITYKVSDDGSTSLETGDFESFHSVLSILSYLLKAPMVPDGTPIVNALFRQRACLENILRSCVGLPPEDHMLLEFKAFKQLKHPSAFKKQ